MGVEFDRSAGDLAEQLRLEDRKGTLRTLLSLRFGEVPSRLDARIEQADLRQVDRWFERLADATSVAEVLKD
jgi:hypothetical protein